MSQIDAGGSATRRRKAVVSYSSAFLQRWQTGAKITLFTLILMALALGSGGMAACLVYGLFIVLPAEALFHTYALEHYWDAVFVFGCVVWGFEFVGKSKRLLAEVMS
jgi:hypothetical protein